MHDITLIISACRYPLAEICVASVRRLYPGLPIAVAFDNKDQVDDERKDFFRALPNILVLPDEFRLGHGAQLDRMIREWVGTRWVVTCDDDVFFVRTGALEALMSNLEDGVVLVGPVEPHKIYKKIINYAPKVAPYLSGLSRREFMDYRMSFKRFFPKPYASDDLFDGVLEGGGALALDVGAHPFATCLIHGLRVKDATAEIKRSAVHVEGASYRLFTPGYWRRNFFKQCRDKMRIPWITWDDFDPEKLDAKQKDMLRKVCAASAVFGDWIDFGECNVSPLERWLTSSSSTEGEPCRD